MGPQSAQNLVWGPQGEVKRFVAALNWQSTVKYYGEWFPGTLNGALSLKDLVHGEGSELAVAGSGTVTAAEARSEA